MCWTSLMLNTIWARKCPIWEHLRRDMANKPIIVGMCWTGLMLNTWTSSSGRQVWTQWHAARRNWKQLSAWDCQLCQMEIHGECSICWSYLRQEDRHTTREMMWQSLLTWLTVFALASGQNYPHFGGGVPPHYDTNIFIQWGDCIKKFSTTNF